MDTNQNPVYQNPASPTMKAIDMGGDAKTTVIEQPGTAEPKVPSIKERKEKVMADAKAAEPWKPPTVIRRPTRVKFDPLGNPMTASPAAADAPTLLVPEKTAAAGGPSPKPTGQEPATKGASDGQKAEAEKTEGILGKKPDEREIYARSMADLVRQDRKLREEQAQMKREREELTARLEKVKELESFAQELAADPLAALQKKGLSYDDLTQRVWNKNQATPDQKIKSLETRIEQLVQKLEERDTQTQQQSLQTAVRNAQGAVRNIVESASDKYPYLSFTQDYDGIVQLVAQHYQETGEQLTLRQACDKLENDYAVQDQRLRAHLGKRAGGKPPEPVPEVEPEANRPGPPPKSPAAAPDGPSPTLTSQQIATVQATGRPQRFRSEAERIAHAVRAWK